MPVSSTKHSSSLPPDADPAEQPDPAERLRTPRSRRALLAGLAGGAGALIANAVSRVSPSRAAAGDPIVLGQNNFAGGKNTQLTTSTSGRAFEVIQNGSGAAIRGKGLAGNGGNFVTAAWNKFAFMAQHDGTGTGSGGAVSARGKLNHGLVASTDAASRYAVSATNTAGSFDSGAAVYADGGQNSAIIARCGTSDAVAVDVASTGGLAVQGLTDTGTGVYGIATDGGHGVRGNSPAGTGVTGTSSSGYGVWASSGSDAGLHAESVHSTAVEATSTNGNGIRGTSESASGIGVEGDCAEGRGVVGSSVTNAGVHGTSATSVGVVGETLAPDGFGMSARNLATETGAAGALEAAGGVNTGVLATTNDASSAAVHALHSAADGVAVLVENTVGGSGSNAGVGIRALTGGATVADLHPYTALPEAAGEFAGPIGVIGVTNVSDGSPAYGVVGASQAFVGVHGFSASYMGVFGLSTTGVGVYGSSDSGDAGVFQGSVTTTSYIQMQELAADPAAAPANAARLFLRDDGSGKSELCVRFASGAVQVIATEP